MRQKKWIIFAVVLVGMASLLAAPEAVDYIRYRHSGADEAQRDIAHGRLELRGFGLPARELPEYARLLSDRLGVHYTAVAGCVVSRRLVKQTRDYNKVMQREIERRHGAGILETLFHEAGIAHAASQPAA